ncbi:MAG: hypothetical protein P1U77_16400 [Rubripirellula sp.]|jgi:hypothetical protein|nr:hypothetical protein [Rubripirellula sp.]
MNRYRNGIYLILLMAACSLALSVYLWIYVDSEKGIFVGLWVPSILAFGSLVLSGRNGVILSGKSKS